MLAGYALGIWLLTVIVKTMPVSIAYAIWAGLGTAAVAVIGWLWLGEAMNPGAEFQTGTPSGLLETGSSLMQGDVR